MNLLTLTEIRRAAQNGAASARVHVQVESATPKLTREQQPYCELTLADACDRMTLRVWSDHPAYKTCSALTSRGFHRAHRGVLPVAIRTRRTQVDGAAVDRAGKKRIAARPRRFARQTGIRLGIHQAIHGCDQRSAIVRVVRSVSSTNGATGFVAPQQRANIIMRGAAASSSTRRK